jgi:hypothetical protein
MECKELIKERISITKDLMDVTNRRIKLAKKELDYLDDGSYDPNIEKIKLVIKQLKLQVKELKINIQKDENKLD